MDDPTNERLSRYLDGDLGPDEAREFAAQVASDPRLRNRLREIEETRSALGAMAARDQPPLELDRVIEPLLRSAPVRVGARPWVRWLATAAAVVLGVTVITQVNRQGIGPTMPLERSTRSQGAPAEPTERFALAPLPTSSLPIDEQPVGAGDRLIASPVPEMVFEESPALEVIGPLESAPETEEKTDLMDHDQTSTGYNMVADQAVAAPAPGRSHETATMRILVPSPPPSKEEFDTAQKSAAAAPESAPAGKDSVADGLGSRQPAMQAQLFIFDEDRTEWRDFEPTDRCKNGRYALRVRVEGGRVVEVWPVGAATSRAPQERLCAAGLVTDLEMTDVPDGEYHAEVVIEVGSPGGR